MMHRVVMPFPCSWDGVTAIDLEVGDVRDFGTMADGLIGIGWIEPIAEKAVVAVETVAEREVSVDMLPVETTEAVVNDEIATDMAAPQTTRRGRKRN